MEISMIIYLTQINQVGQSHNPTQINQIDLPSYDSILKFLYGMECNSLDWFKFKYLYFSLIFMIKIVYAKLKFLTPNDFKPLNQINLIHLLFYLDII